MRKEVILAIIIGLLLGSVLVYGLHRANQAITPPDQQTSLSPSPTPTPAPLLTINSPFDGQIFTTNTATISGRTQPGNALIILTEEDELTPSLDQAGKFSQSIDLITGGNLIQVTAISPSGQRQDEFLNLVVTQKLD